jgi:2-polyprenyl-6-methoxyphenol hydroxylase-like FAD-dependent oxidoreductase
VAKRNEDLMKHNYSNELRHAVVIGGSIAGLLAARVLSDYYEQVTLVERDALPVSREGRRGVPQGRHTHGLLASGRNVLETLFPGISNELIVAGAVNGDILGDVRWFLEGAYHARFVSGLDGLMMSRPFLEAGLRERVRQLPNVVFRDNCAISGLANENGRVTGVETKEGVLAANLVVDTSGRGAHSPQWLEAMGYAKPGEERVEVGLNYTTRWFRRSPAELDGDVAAVIPPTPSGKRGGVLVAQEGGRWTVTLASHFGPAAPAELEGFIEFAKTIPSPHIYEVIRHAEPIGEGVTTRFPASVRRRYEKLDRFPAGYLVMGDAISSFNPVYGQGMSAAALEAMELQAVLREGTEKLASRFFRRVSKLVDIPWSMAVGNDLRMPETVGRRGFAAKAINAYVAKVHKAAQIDPVVALAFHKAGNLLASPASLFAPRIALRVLWSNLRGLSKQARSSQMLRTRAAQ